MPRTETPPQDNGVAPTAVEAPQMFTLDVTPEEVVLVYSMCAQGTFQESVAKRAAAGLQDKTEPIVQQLRGQQ